MFWFSKMLLCDSVGTYTPYYQVPSRKHDSTRMVRKCQECLLQATLQTSSLPPVPEAGLLLKKLRSTTGVHLAMKSTTSTVHVSGKKHERTRYTNNVNIYLDFQEAHLAVDVPAILASGSFQKWRIEAWILRQHMVRWTSVGAWGVLKLKPKTGQAVPNGSKRELLCQPVAIESQHIWLYLLDDAGVATRCYFHKTPVIIQTCCWSDSNPNPKSLLNVSTKAVENSRVIMKYYKI